MTYWEKFIVTMAITRIDQVIPDPCHSHNENTNLTLLNVIIGVCVISCMNMRFPKWMLLICRNESVVYVALEANTAVLY